MYLTELHIQGFKSFARGTDLTFPSAVTAIVGPNGSGKSNVAEALRFVLGEQSVKSLRGKRGEDLIWGGSDAVARANRASVSLKLNNESRILPLDVDTIAIERVVHRDGQNEYRLNEQAVRLKDIHELLAAGNIGPSGHHIISQGEADRVLSATPLERRAMIEEALGLKVYQYKKQDAEKKLEKTQQNIAEVNSLRREIAPHLQYLKRELDKITKARELKAKLQDFYSEYLRREDVYLAAQYERVKTEETKVTQALTEAQTRIEKINSTISEEGSPTEVDDSAERAAVRSAQEQLRSAEEGSNRTAGRITALEEQIQAMAEDGQTVHVPLEKVETQWEAAQTAADKQADPESASAMSKAYQLLVENFSSWLKQARKITDTQELESLQARLKELQAVYDQEKKSVTQVQAILEQAEQALEDKQQAVREGQRSREESTVALYEAKSKVSELQAELQRCEHELSIIERERQTFKDDLQEAVALLGRGASEYFSYQVKDEQGQSVTLEAIQQESRSAQRDRKRELERMKIKLETLGEGASDELEKEYATTKERDDFLAQEVADLEASVKTLTDLINDLEQQIDAQFQDGFQKIRSEFQNFFTLMFGGGSAGLELVASAATANASEDEQEAEASGPQRGIEITLKLPNKRVTGLAMLSGGERALTSTALIFAMSQVHPPLFIVLDETDAALDEANSRRYGDLIEALAKRSQLLLITHNRETMSRAGTLYGVTMGETGVSQILSVQFEEALTSAK